MQAVVQLQRYHRGPLGPCLWFTGCGLSSQVSSMSAATSIRLSKSRFVAGVQCLKRLYLQVHQPELAGEIDEGQAVRFEQGHEVGVLAQAAFPGGVLVDSDAFDLEGALERTAGL